MAAGWRTLRRGHGTVVPTCLGLPTCARRSTWVASLLDVAALLDGVCYERGCGGYWVGVLSRAHWELGVAQRCLNAEQSVNA